MVAGIELAGELKVGDRIHTNGNTTDLEIAVESMQIQNDDVSEASAGDEVGVKVSDRLRPGDKVYKMED
jgi:putative protease